MGSRRQRDADRAIADDAPDSYSRRERCCRSSRHTKEGQTRYPDEIDQDQYDDLDKFDRTSCEDAAQRSTFLSCTINDIIIISTNS